VHLKRESPIKRQGVVVSFAAAILLAFFFLALSGCGAATDVVGKFAVESFGPVAAASAERIAYANGVWTLASVGGDEVRVSVDPTRSDRGDVEFSLDAAPFLAAGLDVAKLVAPTTLQAPSEVTYALADGRLVMRFELGSQPFSIDSSKSIEKAIAELVRTQRERIGYHAALDHYGIKLGGGHMFEWAKDISKNDKDIVWVLNPEPFVAAGVDPGKVEGWSFAKVEMIDNGKKVQVDRLLKPFDLK
jgi:hypothetical protein